MARPTLTSTQRFAAVKIAADDVHSALMRAAQAADDYGYADARTQQAFATVEMIGATIHRQSRILAGKSRGG